MLVYPSRHTDTTLNRSVTTGHNPLNQDTLIRNYISGLAQENGLNKFITVSFTHSRYGEPLWKTDAPAVSGLFGMFAKHLSETAYGRTRKLYRSPDKWIPLVAIPEYKKRCGEGTFLHYHVATLFPEDKAMKLEMASRKFWNKHGIQHFGCIPILDFETAYDAYGAVGYSMKHMDFGFTFENSVIVGLRSRI